MRTEIGSECEFVVRPYRSTDRHAVRRLAANDEFERSRLLARYPKWGEYRADGLARFCDLEPASCLVDEAGGEVVHRWGDVLALLAATVSSLVRGARRSRSARRQIG